MRRLLAMTSKVAMTDKEIALELLRRVPDDASLHDIAQRLQFIAAVQRGLSELDDSGSISIEQVEPELPPWSFTTIRKRRRRQTQKAGDS